jgi:hypothetical protein
VTEIGWFLFYYNWMLLLLLPLALFAMSVNRLERTHPRLMFRIGIVLATAVVVVAVWECAIAFRTGSWSLKTVLHVLAAMAAAFATWGKSREWLRSTRVR